MHPFRRGKTIHILTGLFIALAVIGSGSRTAGAQENGLASITIYASLCPEGYQGDDFYADCYDTPAGAGIDYTLTDLNDTSRIYVGASAASGFAAIEGIDQDSFYQLAFEVPFAISSAPGNCSEDGNPFPVGSEYQFNLTTDNDIRCDVFVVPAGDDAENGLASITIYKAICPVGYIGTSYYADCYDTPGAGIDFTLTNLNTDESADGTTGASGFVAFEGIDTDGAYVLSEEIPGDFNDIVVDCSEDGADFPVTNDGNFIYLDLTTANDIRCDWYNIPVDSQGDNGSLTIYKTACPVGYDGDDYYTDCYDNPIKDVTFTASPQRENPNVPGEPVSGKTDVNGVVVLTLPQSTYGVTEDVPGEFIDRFFVYCSLDGQRLEIGSNEQGILVDIPAAADVHCDWYNVPTDARGESGSVTIYKTACPAGYTGTDYYKDCYDNPQSGIGFAAFAPKLDFSAQGATNANGFVTLPLPAETSAGGILVVESPNIEVPSGGNVPFYVYCMVDGDRLDVTYSLLQLDPGGDAYAASISPQVGDDVRCDWYNLPPKKSTPSPSPTPSPTQPVVQLPSTGAGGPDGEAIDGLSFGLALLSIVGVSVMASGAWRLGRRAA